MHSNYTLEEASDMINKQAIKKQWKREALYCIRRIRGEPGKKGELEELEEAIKQGKSQEEIAIEGIDVLYFLFQAIQAKAPDVPLSVAFYKKYESNWVNLKKTEDEDGNVVLK